MKGVSVVGHKAGAGDEGFKSNSGRWMLRSSEIVVDLQPLGAWMALAAGKSTRTMTYKMRFWPTVSLIYGIHCHLLCSSSMCNSHLPNKYGWGHIQFLEDISLPVYDRVVAWEFSFEVERFIIGSTELKRYLKKIKIIEWRIKWGPKKLRIKWGSRKCRNILNDQLISDTWNDESRKWRKNSQPRQCRITWIIKSDKQNDESRKRRIRWLIKKVENKKVRKWMLKWEFRKICGNKI